MILDEITVHNFGLYRGRQSMSLAPPSPNKPIIMVGGLNGGGKTTLLDSIQLALYGKRARTSNRGSLSYDEYLRRSVNTGVAASEGAAIEVQFRQSFEGHERTYRIHRSWSERSSGMAERVEVLRDGRLDTPLTDSWDQLIEEIIPSGLSGLFFFDGEKIEAFADVENSAQLISKALHALLGLDLVDRLSDDLIMLANRQQASVKSDLERVQMEHAETEIAQLEQSRTELVELRGSRQNELDRLEKRLKEYELRYELEGGLLADERKVLTEKRLRIEKQLREIEDQLRTFAAGPAPLLMLSGLLKAAAEQHKTEDEVRAGNRFQTLIRTRDESLLTEASRLSANKKLIKSLTAFLAEDRKERSKGLKRKPYLNLNNEGRDLLLHLANRSTLLQLNDEAVRLHAMALRVAKELSDADQIIAAIPDEKSLAPILADIETTKTAIRNAQVDLATVDVEIERLSRARERLKSKWLQQVESSLTSKLKNEDVQRLIIHSGRVRQTLNKFRVAVAQRHVKRVEQLVLDCFQQLLRKKSLISTLRIDPEQFSLQLLDSDHRILSPDRLSAGERQLLAVSMLWGLARASGRPLPTIIDTPLGRLDASHRSNLVDRYFPYASHQVLLLSTDEEINKSHYRKLRPWIGRSYLLDYDDKRGATTIQQGYFW